MKIDDKGKTKLIEFIKDAVRPDVEELRKEHQCFKETVKTLVAEQLNLMSIIIKHNDLITQLQKGQTNLKKKIRAIPVTEFGPVPNRDTLSDNDERSGKGATGTAHEEGSKILKTIMSRDEGGDQREVDESFDDILTAVEEIVDKSRKEFLTNGNDDLGSEVPQPVASSMQMWARQTFGQQLPMPEAIRGYTPVPQTRPITTTLKNGSSGRNQQRLGDVNGVHNDQSLTCKLVSSSRKETMPTIMTLRTGVSRADQGKSLNFSRSSVQQPLSGIPRPGTYSRKRVKSKKEKLEHIRTTVPPMPALTFDRVSKLQSTENMWKRKITRDELSGHLKLIPAGGAQTIMKSRFPPIQQQSGMTKPQQRHSISKVIAPKVSNKEMPAVSPWNQNRSARHDLYPGGSSTIFKRPAPRKLPSPRTRIREHFSSLKNK